MNNLEDNKIISADFSKNEDQSAELTEEQVQQVYNSLNAADPTNSLEKLAAAEKETEESNYTEIEEIPEFNQDTAEKVIPENVIKQSILDYNLGVTDDEALSLARVILEYRKNPNDKYFDRLPESIKTLVRNMMSQINTPQNKHSKISKDNATKFFLDTFIGDAELQMALDEFNQSIDSAFTEMDTELSKVFSEAYEEEFNKITEYETEDPEKAEKIKKIKESFDAAKPPFYRLMNWLDSGINAYKLIYKKADLRFRDETSYFNSKVNVTDVKVPNIEELVDVILLHDPTKSKDEVKRFVVAICRHVYNNDFTDIGELSYAYRLVDNIYRYKFITPAMEDDKSKELFGAISAVIDKINSLARR